MKFLFFLALCKECRARPGVLLTNCCSRAFILPSLGLILHSSGYSCITGATVQSCPFSPRFCYLRFSFCAYFVLIKQWSTLRSFLGTRSVFRPYNALPAPNICLQVIVSLRHLSRLFCIALNTGPSSTMALNGGLCCHQSATCRHGTQQNVLQIWNNLFIYH